MMHKIMDVIRVLIFISVWMGASIAFWTSI